MDLLWLLLEQLKLFCCSMLASLLASISGGGGGFILLPALILFGLPFLEALGTHKASMLFIGLGNLSRKNSLQNFNLHLCLILLCIGVPGVILGTVLVSLVPERTAKITLGLLSILMSVYTLCSKNLIADKGESKPSRLRMSLGVLLILLIALLAGALSTGAGIFLTIILTLCFNLELKQAIRYSVIFASTVWNLVGAITVGMMVPIAWHWLPVLLAGSFVGGMLGARVLNHLSKRAVKYLFTTVACLSGVLLII
ncbi:MAG: sulfite exporter TauE/SafE family protein [Succinivibrio sp.]|nr:sulfite exporter TauE/SafE family protein [Succinivibrio sp.]